MRRSRYFRLFFPFFSFSFIFNIAIIAGPPTPLQPLLRPPRGSESLRSRPTAPKSQSLRIPPVRLPPALPRLHVSPFLQPPLPLAFEFPKLFPSQSLTLPSSPPGPPKCPSPAPQTPLAPHRPTGTFRLFSAAASSHTPQASSSGPERPMAAEEASLASRGSGSSRLRDPHHRLRQRSDLAPPLGAGLRRRPDAGTAPSVCAGRPRLRPLLSPAPRRKDHRPSSRVYLEPFSLCEGLRVLLSSFKGWIPGNMLCGRVCDSAQGTCIFFLLS